VTFKGFGGGRSGCFGGGVLEKREKKNRNPLIELEWRPLSLASELHRMRVNEERIRF
jgi:hypothetical protein